MPTVGRGASNSSRGCCSTRGRDLNGRKVLAYEVEAAQRLEAARLEAEAAQLEVERLEAERLEAERLEAERLEAERLEAERLVSSQGEAVQTYMNRARAPLRVFPVHESQSASGMCGPPPGYIHHVDPRFNYQPGRVFVDNIHFPGQPVNPVILERERANEIDRCNKLKMGRVDGGRKKKSRQKKQHHRRNRRHSTRKHKK
jgi:hypothetical protein